MRNNNSKNNSDQKKKKKILPLLNKTSTISKFPMLAAEWSGAHPSSSALFITIADSSIADSTFTTWSHQNHFTTLKNAKIQTLTPNSFIQTSITPNTSQKSIQKLK